MATGFSSQNSGYRPRTTAVGGRNFQPDAGNPDLWPVFNDQGRQRINARIRPENTRLMGGGIDAFKMVNSPYGRRNGIGFKQAENAVQEMRRGMNDPNRPLFDLNPYSRGNEGSRIDKWGNQMAGPSQISSPQVMEDENGEPFNPENAAPAISQAAPATRPRSNLQPLAEEIRARRDFSRGEAPVQRGTENGIPTLTKMNPYGTATATLGPSTGVRQGIMPDPLTGQMVPMRQWAADQSAVQATKYGPDSQQAGGNSLSTPAIVGGISAKMAAPRAAIPAPSTAPIMQGLASSPYSSPYSSPMRSAVNNQGFGILTAEEATDNMLYQALRSAPTAQYGIFAAKNPSQGQLAMPNTPFGAREPLNAASGKRFHDLASGKVTPGMGAMIGGITGRK